jgi:hypothetical protein
MRAVRMGGLVWCLLLVSALSAVSPLAYPWVVGLHIPCVIYLGVSRSVPLLYGSAMSFGIGYLADVFSGSPMSLQTMGAMVTFTLVRVAGLRVYARGRVFQLLLNFAITAVVSALLTVLEALFDKPAPFSVVLVSRDAAAIGAYSLLTALATPVVFWLLKSTHVAEPRGYREATQLP